MDRHADTEKREAAAAPHEGGVSAATRGNEGKLSLFLDIQKLCQLVTRE